MDIQTKTKKLIQTKLLTWYQKNRRDLPWRKTQDPYAIWVSEIMLQQTQVATVIPYYLKFMKEFSSVTQLASVTEEEVLAMWSGLGYYRRAKLLHKGTKEIVKNWRAKLPSAPQDLIKIPGIGPYTAGAIASIAFGRPVPLVDGNVIRVIARLFCIKGSAKSSRLKNTIWSMANQLVHHKHPGDFNQALMELGATICRPYMPSCMRCPLKKNCQAYAKEAVEDFPEKASSKKRIQLKRIVAICKKGSKILLVKRKNPRWLNGMWELPHDYVTDLNEVTEDKRLYKKLSSVTTATAVAASSVTRQNDPNLSILNDFLHSQLGIRLINPKATSVTKHQITHHQIISMGWIGKIEGRLKSSDIYTTHHFFTPTELQHIPLANLDLKVLKSVKCL